MTSASLKYDYPTPPNDIHRAFRYPAKFHPPVARALVERYSRAGDHLLDPFCGSGTLLVEGAIAGRHTTGHDVDPLAVFISEAKLTRYDIAELTSVWAAMENIVLKLREKRDDRLDLKFMDLTADELDQQLAGLTLPAIPNIDHWFRRYVQLDLARLQHAIQNCDASPAAKAFLELAFASVIRRSSNADPVPVSGLEVTAHMKKRDLDGRVVDAFSFFQQRGRRLLAAVKSFDGARDSSVSYTISQHDARTPFSGERPHAIITSPPYQNAVDYYRRHQLEMFWLGLTESQTDRLALLPQYVGRAKVPLRDPFLNTDFDNHPLADTWYQEIQASSASRARDFKAYFSSMTSVLAEIETFARPGAAVVFVVGRSRWGQYEIPTEELFKQLVPEGLTLTEHLTYGITNRTMSYTRHNGASIDVEHVLAFEKDADTP